MIEHVPNLYQQTQACKTKQHPTYIYIYIYNVLGGRVYLKGKSPIEGVWHDIHIPYDNHAVEKQHQFLTKQGHIKEFDDDENPQLSAQTFQSVL